MCGYSALEKPEGDFLLTHTTKYVQKVGSTLSGQRRWI